eukprot:5104832-Pyramimonas_sp.AAC.1
MTYRGKPVTEAMSIILLRDIRSGRLPLNTIQHELHSARLCPEVLVLAPSRTAGPCHELAPKLGTAVCETWRAAAASQGSALAGAGLRKVSEVIKWQCVGPGQEQLPKYP